MQKPIEVLREVFGYSSFRGQQAKIIDHLIAGGDALALMSTGEGKSLCYQIPAILRPGVGVIVSPLIALMQNQVDALRALEVRADYLCSAMEQSEAAAIEQQLSRGKLDLIYVSPERIFTERFKDILDTLYEKNRIALFAIDEAHCISQWGHDFRSDYRQLSKLAVRYPDVPRIALTATADAATRRDITAQLHLEQGKTFLSSFDRPNIDHTVVEGGDQKRQLLDLLSRHVGKAGIVYCQTRDEVEQIAQWLKAKGIKAAAYHAGLDNEERRENQRRFITKCGIVMVATEAFGMGIDKCNVRFVALLGLPKTLEEYYQQVGRAGRDGEPAEAWMCFAAKDVVRHRHHINESEASNQLKLARNGKLNAMLQWARTTQCRRSTLLEYFGERAVCCGECDNCINPSAPTGQKVLPPKGPSSDLNVFDWTAPLITALRGWRSTKGREERLPVFRILSDIALQNLVAHRPSTMADLLLVPGVGQAKASRYGKALLGLLAPSP
jgi:ATP-dependent DNA helicase RecQ